MKDGRLNKCSSCVIEHVNAWRKQNPDVRKKEYLKRKPKLGITRTWEEYIVKLKSIAKGRKASSHEYSSKRRIAKSKVVMTEFDNLVQTEAIDLCRLRKEVTGIKWSVDHIVPLRYKHACGLHNGYNLQVVPASWNSKKGNRNMDVYFDISV